MTDPITSNTDEKATVVHPDKKANKSGFFSRKRRSLVDEKSEKPAELSADIPQENDVIPISFVQLFRYSTKFELFLDFIGLIAAAAAGAALPLMSLFIGRLTQDFVNFQMALYYAHAGDQNAAAKIPQAAANFLHAATQNAIFFVYIGLAIFVCTFVYMYIWVYTGEVNAKRIREKYLRAVLRQDIAFFDKVGAGEVTTRIQTDTHLVQQGISEKVALATNALASFVTGFALAYSGSWRLALALSAMLPFLGITGATMSKVITGYTQLSLKQVGEAGSIAEEVISTVRTAQAFGTQKALGGLYNERINKALRVNLKSATVHGVGVACFFFFIYSGYALAFNFGTTLINQGHAGAGDVVNVLFAILIGSFSLALVALEMDAVNKGRGAAAKVYDTIDRVPDIDSADPNGEKLDNVKGEITFEGVNFSYPARPTVQVVKGLNITFAAGKTAALVGASGSGKSTIISLVERFYDPTDGVVKLDGHNVKDLNLKWHRNQIGLVSQEPVLFATTIKNNVAHGLIGTQYENASEEEKDVLIKDACLKANADGFISKLPGGYNTVVGERGCLLSGGQKQRVAIARAIVSDPRILLLDEATSALDTQSEGIVQDALDKAAAGRTTITIAHRLSTIKDADIIHVMDDGIVLESGNHEELLGLNGAYSQLVHTQKLREGKELESAEGSKDVVDMEETAREEDPLGRRNTSQSLASEILAQKRKAAEDSGKKHDDDYNIPYLFLRMAPLIRDQWKNYFIGCFFALVTGLLYPAYAFIFSKGIEGFAKIDPRERRHDGDRNALWLFVIAILSAIAIGFQNYLFGYAASTLTARLRILSFKAVLRQDIEFFDQDKNSTGALTAQLSDNPRKVNGLAGITLGAIVQSLATLISSVVVGLVFLWKVGIVALACAPLLVSTGYTRLRVVVLKDQTNKKAHEESAQLACEAAGSIRTVASLTREDDCVRLYSSRLEETLHKSNRTALWSNLLYAFTQAQTFFIVALIFWWGATLVSRLEATLLQFFIAVMSTTFGANQAGNVFTFAPDISTAKGAASDIIKLLDSQVEIDAESTEGKVIDPATTKGHIRFENIHFRYPTRPGVRVLRNLSLEVEPGTYVALVGASGSGKSTIIQLIERFYDPLAGDVYLDGEKISELNVQEYRKNLALVSQEPTLYAGTVRFNILLGATKPAEEVSRSEIEAACRDANILEFIQGLPNGFDTEVGGKGSQLSGGQKQRIAIARALLRNPKVLLLDEATSALDSNSEKVVQVALDQAAKGRTTIAIAHRLSTIQNADKIYFIKEGHITESGTHDQLIAKHGDYCECVHLQGLSGRE